MLLTEENIENLAKFAGFCVIKSIKTGAKFNVYSDANYNIYVTLENDDYTLTNRVKI